MKCLTRTEVTAIFLSTLSVRRATVIATALRPRRSAISIHALREESDSTVSVCTPSSSLFLSTLSVRRATASMRTGRAAARRFLSTLSVRRATVQPPHTAKPVKFLSTLSVRRATTSLPQQGQGTKFLSTLSVRRATGGWRSSGIGSIFLSTLSVRRATTKLADPLTGIRISIHALREESDLKAGRRYILIEISIHALREESDTSSILFDCVCLTDFYPRSP